MTLPLLPPHASLALYETARPPRSNTNTIVETAPRIISDPAVATGLVAAVPALGIASAVFEIIRTTFFGTGQARVIRGPTQVQFRGMPGIGIPLKIGRYAFLSTKLRPDQVQDSYRYRGGRLVDITNGNKEVKDVDHFYLDIYAS